MKLVPGIQVLLVSAEPEALELATVWLRSEGAVLRVVGWNDADHAYQQVRPQVLVADLTHEGSAHWSAAEAFARATPTLALVSRDRDGASDAISGKIHKRIVQPIHPADLVQAVATLAVPVAPQPVTSPGQELGREELFAKVLRARAAGRDVRGLLGVVNASGPFRFTSVLRFDGEHLTSVWTYDRQLPEVDSFPVDKTISASYCALVRESHAPFELSDANTDPRVSEHPARHQVRSYCGAPLLRRDGTLYGTLCHFDERPRVYPSTTLAKLEQAAEVLRELLVEVMEATDRVPVL